MRTSLLPAIAVALCVPAAAGAAGFPVSGVDTTKVGATTPGSPYRYVAFTGRHDTVVAKLERSGGAPLRARRLPGRMVVAAVAQDASTTGLSADGATLVLGPPRGAFPARSTRLTVLNTASLRLVRTVRLPGDFALDGISPDGRRLFLVEYRGSPTDYAVRAYDVGRGSLLPRPVVDPRNPAEKMTGFPLTRSVSADGRWAYTLYAGGNEPFVHALDTARGRAFCVDLPGVLSDTLNEARLVVRHGRIDLVQPGGATERRIDATTFRVSTPVRTRSVRASAPAYTHARDDGPPSDSFPWGLAAVVAAVATAAAGFALRRRYAAGTDSETSRSASSSTPTVP